MKLPGWLVAVATWLLLMQQAVAVDYGAGFSLSLDYGTSVVYYENGTTVGVAKIEGSPAYKELMHAQHWLTPNEFPIGNPSQQMPILPHVTIPDPGCEHLPYWLRDQCSLDKSTTTISQMLRGLKAATESYLDEDISYVSIATPNLATETFTNVLENAATRAALKQEDVGWLRANTLAADANTVLDIYCTEPSRFVLAMDYSRAGLTATLIEDDCGVPLDLITIHDRSVGTQQWSEESRTDLVELLRKFIRQGQFEWGDEGPISKLVLLGECAEDERLKDLLREVLLDEEISQPIMPWHMHSNSIDVHKPVDPLFAASAGAAQRAWALLKHEEKGHSPSSGLELRLVHILRPRPVEQRTSNSLNLRGGGAFAPA